MYRYCLFFVLLLMLLSCDNKPSTEEASTLATAIPAKPDTAQGPQIWTPERERLTRAYSLQHYGAEQVSIQPQMIVVHYTAIPTLEQTLAYFTPDTLAQGRDKIKKHSQLNVSSHYVVARDGKLYQLLPDTVMARHIIGYNHVAIGIENVAADSTALSDAQLATNVQLIRHLSSRYPDIRFLIGHQEYDEQGAAHTLLYKAMDTTYHPYPKPDPGKTFMQAIRDSLAHHGIRLKS